MIDSLAKCPDAPGFAKLANSRKQLHFLLDDRHYRWFTGGWFFTFRLVGNGPEKTHDGDLK